MIEEDLDAYLADHGGPVFIGNTQYMGIFESPDQNLAIGNGPAMKSAMYTVLMKTSDVIAAGVARKTLLTIDSVVYEAHNPVRVDDGAFSNVPLSAQ